MELFESTRFRNFIEDFFNVDQKVYIISKIVNSNMNYTLLFISNTYKQHQAEIGKKSSKS